MEKNYIYILSELEKAGFEAYIVGGCVRDLCIGNQPHDFDITTNALPEQIIQVFADKKVILTGLKHGTVTVIHNGETFEVTTFRIDGKYSDSRRPDSVKFTSSLKEDLARRDFTMNAMAMDKNGTLYDYHNGKSDIENHVIRCVGSPEMRFTEDALRILRAVRFSAVLGFDIEEKTAESAIELKKRLGHVSAERIRTELVKTLCGKNVVDVMLKYREIIAQIIPEMRECFDFNQYSKYHKYDVYEHIVRALGSVPVDSPDCEILRTALLFHDIGKPAVCRIDEKGKGHFSGHAKVSADIACDIMHNLKFDNKTVETVRTIIANHGDVFDFNNSDTIPENHIKRMIHEIGEERFFLLLELKKADNLAKHDFVLDENKLIDNIAETARKLIADNCCMSLAQLDINGNDVSAIGFKGHEIGECLNSLLYMVMDGEIENKHDILIKTAKELQK